MKRNVVCKVRLCRQHTAAAPPRVNAHLPPRPAPPADTSPGQLSVAGPLGGPPRARPGHGHSLLSEIRPQPGHHHHHRTSGSISLKQHQPDFRRWMRCIFATISCHVPGAERLKGRVPLAVVTPWARRNYIFSVT